MTATDLPLASEFPVATREEWLKLVEGALKGAPFEKKLVSKTYDGLNIEPLYQRRSEAQAIAGRPAAAPWEIMARVDHPDPAEANKLAIEDLENGATGLTVVCKGSIGAYGFGLDGSQAAIERALDGVYLDGIGIEFNLTREAKDVPAHVAALAARKGIAPESVDLRTSFDPLGLMAAGSSAHTPWSAIVPVFGSMVTDLHGKGFRGPFAVADGRVVHNAGGSEAQELAFVLGNALAYLRALEASGIALDTARSLIFFRLSADADQFMTMAKFRAVRKLWARVQEACGLVPKPAFVSAETAWRMMTKRDPYVNMLRTTIAAFSAGLAGANAVGVLPYTNALGLPDSFARRNARNTQLILVEESNLAKVGDPAAGSGGIEALTDELCHAAWTLFQEIEAAGGAAAAIEKGLIQAKVAATRAEREKAVATRKEPITGTSEFPHIGEAPVDVLAVEAAALPAGPLAAIRLAEPFEKLRDASDAILKTTGARPKVFLATLGTPADSIARTTFAKNFFEAGGIEAVEGAPDAFSKSGAALACLCSSDEVYAAEAASAAKALINAGAKRVYLAGRPGELAAALETAGVKSYIYAGCDVLATLTAAHDILRAK